MTGPVVLPQIVQQRQPPLECFDVFAHNAFSPPEHSVVARRRQSQARMVGEGIFLKDAVARDFAKPKLSKAIILLRQQSDDHDPANELNGGRSDGGRKESPASSPDRSTSGGRWMDRVIDQGP